MSESIATESKVELKMYINGEAVDAVSGARQEVRDPATGEVVASVPKGNREDAKNAVDAAEAAFPEWSETGPEERAKLLSKAHDIVHEHAGSLALLLSREQGKPVSEASTEMEHFMHGLNFYAGLASKIRGEQVPLPSFPNKAAYGLVLKRPIGVCVAGNNLKIICCIRHKAPKRNFVIHG